MLSMMGHKSELRARMTNAALARVDSGDEELALWCEAVPLLPSWWYLLPYCSSTIPPPKDEDDDEDGLHNWVFWAYVDSGATFTADRWMIRTASRPSPASRARNGIAGGMLEGSRMRWLRVGVSSCG